MTEENIVPSLLHSFRALLPETALVAVACLVFMGGTFRAGRHLWAFAALLGVALAAALVPLAAAPDFQENVFASPLVADPLGRFLRWLALAGGAVLILFSWNEVEDRTAGDYYGCLLILLAGLSVTGMANDLVTLFLALEMISIPTYVMLYLPQHDDASQEAAMKYFMLSIFSSAVLLFGFSYLYGLTGSTNIAVLVHTVSAAPPSGVPAAALVAVVMVLGGLGFRIAMVPFHFYAPDVYQGTATVMAALLAFVPKVAGFAALLRLFGFVAPPLPAELAVAAPKFGTALSEQVPMLLWFLAAVTMFLGNVLALLQRNLKRLFAYSSVAHAGYMLIALAATPYLASAGADGADGVRALLYYLVAYGSMTVGAFAVIAYLHSPGRPVEDVDDLAGLSRTRPLMALLMTLFLFSLIGIPFTAGFTGKVLIFFGAVSVQPAGSPRLAELFRLLALLGLINAAIGAWYYLRLITAMYLRTAIRPVERRGTVAGFATVAVCAILTIALSIPPGVNWLLGRAGAAVGRAESSASLPAPGAVARER